jgi:uncharacterized membrane protein
MSLFATIFPLICWFAYNNGMPLLERRFTSLTGIMALQRRRWVANAVRRDSPFDAILAGNLMGSVSFLASTAALLVLATFAAFGQVNTIAATLGTLSIEKPPTTTEIELHFVVLLVLFVLGFFAFTLSLRQFNHFCILLGAVDHGRETSEAEIIAIAKLNTLAAQNFNNGIRALYFAVGMIAWFVSSWIAILVTLATVAFLLHREFFPTDHRLDTSVAIAVEPKE